MAKRASRFSLSITFKLPTFTQLAGFSPWAWHWRKMATVKVRSTAVCFFNTIVLPRYLCWAYPWSSASPRRSHKLFACCSWSLRLYKWGAPSPGNIEWRWTAVAKKSPYPWAFSFIKTQSAVLFPPAHMLNNIPPNNIVFCIRKVWKSLMLFQLYLVSLVCRLRQRIQIMFVHTFTQPVFFCFSKYE